MLKKYNNHVWIQTGLEIDMALDASDKDYLTVLPSKAMSNFLEAMERCAYKLFQADAEKPYLSGLEMKFFIPPSAEK